MCVKEIETERERERGVCVCVCKRERERECVCHETLHYMMKQLVSNLLIKTESDLCRWNGVGST